MCAHVCALGGWGVNGATGFVNQNIFLSVGPHLHNGKQGHKRDANEGEKWRGEVWE